MKRSLTVFISAVLLICISIFSCLNFTGCSLAENDARGIQETKINESGELIITYTDGNTVNLGVVVGQNGENGLDGKDGKDGKDGEKGEKGEKGDKGDPGAPGENGLDGKDGKDGEDGADGKDGSIITDGTSADNSYAISLGLRSAVTIISTFTCYKYSLYGQPIGTARKSSAGSGVIYTLDRSEGDAFIITNFHVVYDITSTSSNGIAEQINVYLYGGEYVETAIPASYVGGSANYDIAVLRVENSELLKDSFPCAVTYTDSDNIRVGETAIAIGNPSGGGMSATSGVISVDSEYIQMTAVDESGVVDFRVFRIDTPVNPGNSGGGLFNSKGELIGIVNAKTTNTSIENIGYAIPSNIAIAAANNIIDNCFGKELLKLKKATLGITVSPIESKAVYDIETGRAKIVETVVFSNIDPNAPAATLLKVRDQLVSATLGGETKEITRSFQLIDFLLKIREGDTLTLKIIREGTVMELNFIFEASYFSLF